ncbi:MAG: TIGR04283 family arsenosugar biosynthesis glycosyltransferase [bacterium]
MSPGERPRISIVVPLLDEEPLVADSLDRLRSLDPFEIVAADGGSRDDTAALARARVDRLVVTAPGRAAQLNAAAAVARGDVLLFVHVDTQLPERALAAVAATLADPAVVAGAFRVAIRDPRTRYRVIEWGANLRAALTGIPYGDQAVFVRRALFRELGGFPPLPVLEDVAFARRLKRRGQVRLLRERVANSPRRWEREGLLYATVRNWVITLLFTNGVPAERLQRWYPKVR